MGNVKVYDFRTQQQKEEADLIKRMNENLNGGDKQDDIATHNDSSDYNPDLNISHDHFSPEIVHETIEKQKHLMDPLDVSRLRKAITPRIDKYLNKQEEDSRPVTERIQDVVDFDEAKKMMNDIDAIYADAEVEMDPPYDPDNTNPNFNFNSDIRDFNIGTSDYSRHKIQPWDIWEDYNLNPWDADIVKRVLRKKELPGLDDNDSRIEDYQKIIHICLKRIDQIKKGTNIL